MGKKKAARRSRRATDRVPRKEPYTSQRVSTIVERVKEQTTRLMALARTMDDAELDSVVIDGHAMLLRGLNQIDNFIDNANRAVREAKVAKEGI